MAPAAPGDEFVFGADSPVAPDDDPQQSAEISGNRVVWMGRYLYNSAWRYRIQYKDISDKDSPVITLVPKDSANIGQSDPAISNDLVVWLEGGMVQEVHYTFLGEGCPGNCQDNVIALPGKNPWDIAVYGHRILFQNERAATQNADIYLYDLDNPSAGAQPVTTAPGNQYRPHISDAWLSWADDSTGTVQIHAVPVEGGGERVVDGQHIYDTYSLGGDRLVFTRGYMNHPGVGVYSLDLSNPQAQPMPLSTMEANRPDVDAELGDKAVWESTSRDSGDMEVYMHNFATGVTQRVSSSPADVFGPVISGSHIVWADFRDGVRNLYQNRLGDNARAFAERFKPELHFQHDIDNDSRNDFEPRTVNLMVDAAEKLVIDNGNPIINPSLQDLIDNPGQDNYLDLPGSPAGPFYDYAGDYLTQLGAQGYPLTAYSRVVPKAEGTDKTVIQYWFNYYYNNWYNNHEGDWEMVQVILDENLEPEDVAYAQHGWPWKKGWNEWGVKKTETHPRVFVAEGSHASYFFASSELHFLEPGTPNAFKDETGSASSVIPAVDMNGLNGGWADYEGHWGQAAPAWCPWCDDGPKGPAFQQPRDPWNQPLTWANSSFWKWLANDMAIAVYSPAEINLYDAQGRHVGKNAQGGIDLEIPGSEYFERDDDHSKNIVIHNADILSNYTLKVQGTGAGVMDLKVQAPDFSGNMIENPQYLAVSVNPAMQAELDLNAAKDFDLKVDEDGDGAIDTLISPDTNDQVAVDFSPPATVTDLAVEDTTSGATTLNWTAPGDDGAQGTTFRYDLRYSTEPITEENWQYAKTADSLPDPRPAGSAETATIAGLNAGTTYYFAIKARDDAWQGSTLSNVVQSTTEIPNLTWGIRRIYWASWDDYTNRQLSIDYNLGNSGTGIAKSPAIAASVCNPTSVYVTTPLPLTVPDLNPGTTGIVTLKYYVPTSVSRFTATTYVNCQDDAGKTYWFPGPLP